MRAALALLAALLLGPAAPVVDQAKPPPACSRQTFEGRGYILCPYRPGQDLRLAWQGPDGRPLGSLPALKASLGPAARCVRFAMNAGMYHPDQRPVGLLVAEGRTLAPLATRPGPGNFHDLPNGVFWIDAAGAPHVEETAAFAAAGRAPVWATQSGPLLVQDGRFHPIVGRATRALIRNGVATCGPDLALFVISDGPTTLAQFARFVRDAAGCQDLLYLDGAVSSLWTPNLGRLDTRKGLGPLVVVLE
jgi:uncharacterized protein YigE (DUF2233 family)